MNLHFSTFESHTYQLISSVEVTWVTVARWYVICLFVSWLITLYHYQLPQGRIQDLIGGGPDRDRPKTAILGPQFCRILVLGPHFWWSGGARAPPPPGSAPVPIVQDFILQPCRTEQPMLYR